ncbi:phosphoribosylanthranilate isomerase [Leptobacterium flavescens]|uniref:N-(5'-phosphoribosyl)anthranilate isomerase n=1 Tax=Leptobacterium flavescens TaxID=472055 RepID=A0A6P0UPP0_9FLAO|nr:phosphoribosylanthranilate isomerase [Leptobacterium flavescens]NER12336.1 phosphoribosylanthranilate isomerase [Leptobacterium flavescens]
MKLKVCGMKYRDNIEAVVRLQPDYLGFIFWERSSRFFDGEMPEVPSHIKKTGVFVDASYEEITDKVNRYDLHAVQLHGNETPDLCKKLKGDNLEVIKVFSIKDHFDFSLLQPYEDVCDYYLFDTKGKLPGGNGYGFDWTILNQYPSKKPFFLSGGIGLDEVENVKRILKTDLPIYLIDVNSKFETAPGLKEEKDIKKFKEQLAIE